MNTLLTMMQKNRIAMDAADEVTRPAHLDRCAAPGCRINEKHREEKDIAREVWHQYYGRMTRGEAAREVAAIVRRRTGNDAITHAVVVGWARRGTLD